MRRTAVMLVFLFAALGTGAEAVQVSIDVPSPAECRFENGRDFYVIGRIDREGKSASEAPVDIRVELVKADGAAGKAVVARGVMSRVDPASGVTPKGDIKFDYPGIAPWSGVSNDALAVSPPPDLIMRGEAADSFRDPEVKAAAGADSYAAMIQGGATKDFDTNYRGKYTSDLKDGRYTIIVTAVSGGRAVATAQRDVLFGSGGAKLLGRFSPAAHFERAKSFAKENGLRMYLDPFPGYWNVGVPKTCEIPRRWRANDALEYMSGTVHTILYNIPEKRSASQEVELGAMAAAGRLDGESVRWYLYDAGEPETLYTGTDGREARRRGELKPLADGEKLRFSRAELGPRGEKYFPSKNAGTVDWNVYDSVAMRPGETVTLCGVTPPIAPSPADVTANGDGTYAIKNRTVRVLYRLEEKSRGELLTRDLKTGMERYYDPEDETWASPSIYEFRHRIELGAVPPRSLYTVTTQGFDAHGAPVAGTETMFYLWVR